MFSEEWNRIVTSLHSFRLSIIFSDFNEMHIPNDYKAMKLILNKHLRIFLLNKTPRKAYFSGYVLHQMLQLTEVFF